MENTLSQMFFVRTIRDGVKYRLLCALGVHLKGQIHTKICQNVRLGEFSIKPSQLAYFSIVFALLFVIFFLFCIIDCFNSLLFFDSETALKE